MGVVVPIAPRAYADEEGVVEPTETSTYTFRDRNAVVEVI